MADKPKQVFFFFLQDWNGRTYHWVVLEDIMRLCYVLCQKGMQGVCWVFERAHSSMAKRSMFCQKGQTIDFSLCLLFACLGAWVRVMYNTVETKTQPYV